MEASIGDLIGGIALFQHWLLHMQDSNPRPLVNGKEHLPLQPTINRDFWRSIRNKKMRERIERV